MKHPYDIIQELAATSSKNAKLDILRREKNNDLFKRVCEMALNPFIIFGTTKAPGTKNRTGGISLDKALNDIQKTLVEGKLRGHDQRDYLVDLFTSLDQKNADVLTRVIKKDLDCGVDTAVNKVWENLAPEWPVMLCESKGVSVMPCYAQLKNDGMRINVLVSSKPGAVSYFSRNGQELDFGTRFDQHFLNLAAGGDLVFDGEAVVMAGDKLMERAAGNGIVRKAQHGSITPSELERVHFVLWDMIVMSDWRTEYSNQHYSDRFSRLAERHIMFKTKLTSLCPTKLVQSMAEAQALFDEYVAQGLEGIILKDPKGPWENRRARHQIKMKAENEADLVVVGTEPHSKNPKLIGALVCETSDGKLRTGLGSGLNDELRAKPASYFIGKIVAVKYNVVIEDRKGSVKSLFLPRLVEIRTDKSKANSLRELE